MVYKRQKGMIKSMNGPVTLLTGYVTFSNLLHLNKLSFFLMKWIKAEHLLLIRLLRVLNETVYGRRLAQ